MDKLGRSSSARHHRSRQPEVVEDEVVQANSVFDISSLILYGSQAAPIRLKILLDRLFSVLQAEDVNRIISGFGWSAEDYTRGYIVQTFTNSHTNKLAMVSYNEEMMIIQQFLRFGETKYLAQEFLLQENRQDRLTSEIASHRTNCTTVTSTPPSSVQTTPPPPSAATYGLPTPPYGLITPPYTSRKSSDEAPLTKAALLLGTGLLNHGSSVGHGISSPDHAHRRRKHAYSPENAHKHAVNNGLNNNNNKTNVFANSDLASYLERAKVLDASFNKGSQNCLEMLEEVKREIPSPLHRSTPTFGSSTKDTPRGCHPQATTNDSVSRPFDFSRIAETVALPRAEARIDAAKHSSPVPYRHSLVSRHPLTPTPRDDSSTPPTLKKEESHDVDEEPQPLNFCIKNRSRALATPLVTECSSPAASTPLSVTPNTASVSPLVTGGITSAVNVASPLAASLDLKSTSIPCNGDRVTVAKQSTEPWTRHTDSTLATPTRKTIAISKPISDLPAGAYAAVPRGLEDSGNNGSPSGKKRVLCTSCRKTFCDKGALKIHYSAVHLKEMHACTVPACTMVFSSRRSRNRHSANPNPKLHMPQTRRRVNDSSHRHSSDSSKDSTQTHNAFNIPIPTRSHIIPLNQKEDNTMPRIKYTPKKQFKEEHSDSDLYTEEFADQLSDENYDQNAKNSQIPTYSKLANKRKADNPTKYVAACDNDDNFADADSSEDSAGSEVLTMVVGDVEDDGDVTQNNKMADISMDNHHGNDDADGDKDADTAYNQDDLIENESLNSSLSSVRMHADGEANNADSSFDEEPPNKIGRNGTLGFICTVADCNKMFNTMDERVEHVTEGHGVETRRKVA